MAVRQQLVRRPVSAVWEILEDETLYGAWVVGTSHTRPDCGEWPRVDSAIRYRIRIGPRYVDGRTVVRRLDRPRALELEADGGPLGTARISFDIRPWGEHSLVILDEHPLRGVGGALHNSLVDRAVQLRHRKMLARLARVVEERTDGAGRGAPAVADAG
ncbi:SRPBCC family protein [Streptomyces lonarensis]|uniref:SRPBCC family protein n=1 Tax=Streptomyces lonarensis TaxID=700599 RepID=A0A7X6CXI1_9ACTN|nr:SRPBCC family protein [Streptomyces lonarensis]NJQ04404.1 SRPBCC family protein [Streptomyces lonarensis]